MAVKKASSASKKAHFTGYKANIQAGKNKLAKLERHMKRHPNDAQAADAKGTARNHTGRTAPKRMGARLNPYIGDKSLIALAEVMIENKQASKEELGFQHRSLNLLSGRISAAGKRIQQGMSFAAGVRRQAEYDKNGKVFQKPKLTKAERDLAKARAMGKQEAAGVSKAKAKKLKNSKRPTKA